MDILLTLQSGQWGHESAVTIVGLGSWNDAQLKEQWFVQTQRESGCVGQEKISHCYQTGTILIFTAIFTICNIHLMCWNQNVTPRSDVTPRDWVTQLREVNVASLD